MHVLGMRCEIVERYPIIAINLLKCIRRSGTWTLDAVVERDAAWLPSAKSHRRLSCEMLHVREWQQNRILTVNRTGFTGGRWC